MPPGSAPVQWPGHGYPNHGHPPQGGQGYHFPPPEPGYGHDQQGYAPPQWGQQAEQGGYDLANYLPADPGPFQNHQQQAYETDADYAEEFYEDEEPRSGRRWFFIAAALVGAIGVGGALAYTYRSIVATDSGRVPLVKAEPNVKVKPDHPGGKEFPGSGRKLPNRSAEAPAPAAEEKSIGPRPVKTVRIGEPPAGAPPPQVAAVPGITLENFRPPAAAPAPKAPPKAEEPTAKVEEPPPKVEEPPPAKKRVTIGEKPGPVEADDPPPASARKRPPPVVASIAPPKVAPPPPSSGLGYVAVVSSKRTHIDALKAYADVAQKHPDVLSGKTPDVQEANLGEKGIWFRAVVGPPGSREAARSLCSQLKAAGQDCWIKEY